MNFSVPQIRLIIMALTDKYNANLKIIRHIPECSDDAFIISKAASENRLIKEMLDYLNIQYDKANGN